MRYYLLDFACISCYIIVDTRPGVRLLRLMRSDARATLEEHSMSPESLTISPPKIRESFPTPAWNLTVSRHAGPACAAARGGNTMLRPGDDGQKRTPAPGETPGLHGTYSVLGNSSRAGSCARPGSGRAGWMGKTVMGSVAERRAYGNWQAYSYWHAAILPHWLSSFISVCLLFSFFLLILVEYI